MSIYLIEHTSDTLDELYPHPQVTIYYNVWEKDNIKECYEELFKESNSHILNSTYCAVTELTKENFTDVLKRLPESSDREDIMLSMLKLAEW